MFINNLHTGNRIRQGFISLKEKPIQLSKKLEWSYEKMRLDYREHFTGVGSALGFLIIQSVQRSASPFPTFDDSTIRQSI